MTETTDSAVTAAELDELQKQLRDMQYKVGTPDALTLGDAMKSLTALRRERDEYRSHMIDENEENARPASQEADHIADAGEMVSAPAISGGEMVSVPREPTPLMLKRGAYQVSGLTHVGAEAVYRAMLSAAGQKP